MLAGGGCFLSERSGADLSVLRQTGEGVSFYFDAGSSAEPFTVLVLFCLQKSESAALSQWLLGDGAASSSSSPLTGWQSSDQPQDWLLARSDSKVSSALPPAGGEGRKYHDKYQPDLFYNKSVTTF